MAVARGMGPKETAKFVNLGCHSLGLVGCSFVASVNLLQKQPEKLHSLTMATVRP